MWIVRLSKDEMKRFGSSSLIGKLTNMGMIQPCSFILEFEESSMVWKERNKGPDLVLVAEHVFSCLCDDILTLTKRGYDITIQSWENDPQSKSDA